MATYKIVRHFFKGRKITIRKGCSLSEAQEHCKNPESSSKTATAAHAKKRTRLHGPWFDGYTKE